MNDVPTPRELRGAAAVARTLAYAAGVVGVVAGVLLYQGGDTAFAIAVWVLTFGVGALLMIAAFLLHAMVALLARLHAIESDLRIMVGRRGPDPVLGDDEGRGDPHPNPW